MASDSAGIFANFVHVVVKVVIQGSPMQFSVPFEVPRNLAFHFEKIWLDFYILLPSQMDRLRSDLTRVCVKMIKREIERKNDC